MKDECLEELVAGLFPEARAVLKALGEARDEDGSAVSVEDLLRATGLTTHGVRKGLWGLMGAGLVEMGPGNRGYLLTENGVRAVSSSWPGAKVKDR